MVRQPVHDGLTMRAVGEVTATGAGLRVAQGAREQVFQGCGGWTARHKLARGRGHRCPPELTITAASSASSCTSCQSCLSTRDLAVYTQSIGWPNSRATSAV